MTTTPIAARPLVLADVLGATKVRHLALVSGYVLTIAVAAMVSIPLPVGPVPLTLQTLAVLLGAAALGPGRAVAGTSLYLGLGVIGVPWFAVSGGATVCYLVGFAVAGAFVGAGARAGRDRRVAGAVGLMTVGNLIIYALGVAGLLLATPMGLSAAVAAGVVPFLIGDALKIAVAALLLPGAWRLVDAADRR
jgi:biotin transport system substrate-specific component